MLLGSKEDKCPFYVVLIVDYAWNILKHIMVGLYAVIFVFLAL